MTLQASYNEESHSFELAETMMSSSEKPHDMYQRYRSSKADMLKPVGQVGIRPNAPICSYCVIVFVVVWPKNMYMYKVSSSLFFYYYSYRFLGRQCNGSVKVQAKLK